MKKFLRLILIIQVLCFISCDEHQQPPLIIHDTPLCVVEGVDLEVVDWTGYGNVTGGSRDIILSDSEKLYYISAMIVDSQQPLPYAYLSESGEVMYEKSRGSYPLFKGEWGYVTYSFPDEKNVYYKAIIHLNENTSGKTRSFWFGPLDGKSVNLLIKQSSSQ